MSKLNDLPEVTGKHLACLESRLYLCIHHVPGRGAQAARFALHAAPPSREARPL